MNQTQALFLEDTYLFAALCTVRQTGVDEHGPYFVSDRTIFYPQGGGQPADHGYIALGTETKITIIGAKYTEHGIRHYTDCEVPVEILNNEVAMHIFSDIRKLNAAYHTGGHWLTQLVLENMQLPLSPLKGHHFPNESFIEFDGDLNCITSDSIDELKMAMQIDLQANPKIKVALVDAGSKLFGEALLPKNFKVPINKPLRLTQIEGYRWIPCGGTHTDTLREIKSVTPIEFYSKGGKVRLKYRCEMHPLMAA